MDQSYLFSSQGAGAKEEKGSAVVFSALFLGWFCSGEVKAFLFEIDPSRLAFESSSAQLAWFSLQQEHKKTSLVILIMNNPILRSFFMSRTAAVLSAFANSIAKTRQEEERARLMKRVLKVLSQGSVTMSLLFLFANKVSASDFPGNSFPNGSFQNTPLELTVQEKQRLLLKKVAFWSIAVGTLGAVGYVLSSRAVPYFIRLAPRLRETLVPPVLDILTVLPALPGLEVLEYIPVPSFLTGPFSQKVSTLGARIEEALDFFSVLDGHPAFPLQRYRLKSFEMLELMADHIDNLAVLSALSGGDQFKGKVSLLNDAFTNLCSKNKVIESYCLMMRNQTLNDLLS
jgi:hypothetical protein